MYDVLPLEVIAAIRILEFLFIASSQNGSLLITFKMGLYLITFAVMTQSKGRVHTVKSII